MKCIFVKHIILEYPLYNLVRSIFNFPNTIEKLIEEQKTPILFSYFSKIYKLNLKKF